MLLDFDIPLIVQAGEDVSAHFMCLCDAPITTLLQFHVYIPQLDMPAVHFATVVDDNVPAPAPFH
jgi:hypothetical protein